MSTRTLSRCSAEVHRDRNAVHYANSAANRRIPTAPRRVTFVQTSASRWARCAAGRAGNPGFTRLDDDFAPKNVARRIAAREWLRSSRQCAATRDLAACYSMRTSCVPGAADEALRLDPTAGRPTTIAPCCSSPNRLPAAEVRPQGALRFQPAFPGHARPRGRAARPAPSGDAMTVRRALARIL